MPEFNFPAFNDAAERLRKAGFDVENPADKGIIEGWEWSDYLKYDLKKMIDCDGVATIGEWWFSRGATLEVNVARRLEMPVLDLQTWLDRAES